MTLARNPLRHGQLPSLPFRLAARRSVTAACFHDRCHRDLNLLQRGEHVLSGATDARRHIIFEIPKARRRLTSKAEWFVAVLPDRG